MAAVDVHRLRDIGFRIVPASAVEDVSAGVINEAHALLGAELGHGQRVLEVFPPGPFRLGLAAIGPGKAGGAGDDLGAELCA
jgi:hypothetical protein